MRVIAALLATAWGARAGPGAPERLRVEYMEEPMGVDVSYPLRFSWALEHSERGQQQSAYQIVVSDGNSTVWDSKKTSSNVTQNVPIGIAKLKPDTSYTWSVKWWDNAGTASPEGTAKFSTGLYDEADWKGAKWIGGAMGQYRTEHKLKGAVKRVFAYVIGLGYYKLHVSGKKVSTHELGAFTTYTERVYYDTHDITDQVLLGDDDMMVVGMSLGDGWYTQKSVNVGKPMLMARVSIAYADGTTEDFVSDATWKYNPGPVTSVDIYNGENYNATLETPGWTSATGVLSGEWVTAELAEPPSDHVKLTSHAILPPIRIGEDYSPVNFWQSGPGEYVFDFGQNMAGFATLFLPEGLDTVPGTQIAMFHAEMIHGPPENKSKIYHHYGNAKETNTYTTRGAGEEITYTPLFTYAGFRYIQLTGYPGTPDFKTLTAHFIHTDYEMTGSVSFSDPDLTAVQHITRTAAMSNFQSIPTDCPQRERRGWLGDAQLSAETNMHNFDMGAPYTSFIQQINDQQDPETGAVGDCVPYYGHGKIPADPAWGTAYTFLSDWVGKYYHDNQIFEEHYEGITAHLEELITTSHDNDGACDGKSCDSLLSYSGWGDWCPPEGCAACWPGTPKEHNSVLVSSFYYLAQLRIVSKYAGILGKSTDEKKYGDLASQVAVDFNKHFFNAENATYEEPGRTCREYLSTQTMISLASELDVIPTEHKAAVIQTLVDDIAAHDWHLNCGIVGIKYLLKTLSENGRGDVALMIMQQRTPPSYIYMVEQGATTMWETWTGTEYQPTASRNHIMFGSNSDWSFKYLAGIQQTEAGRGWQELVLQPQVWNDVRGVSICANLSSTEGSIVTPRGMVAGSWTCGGPEGGLCGKAAEKQAVHLSCAAAGGGTIKAISFASFGTPTGSCATGFKSDPACDLKNITAKIEKECVGKSSCSIPASTQFFGSDPCFDTVKSLAISATGCNAGAKPAVFTYDVTIPTGSVAEVHLPKMDLKAAASVTEKEGAVWSGGAYKSGVSGVTGASETASEIVVSVGSGSFAFVVS